MNNRQIRSAVLVLCAAGITSLTRADAVFPGTVLSDAELETLRGGFFLEGLEISIGLEQVVSMDGETLAVNRLTIPNLNQVSNGEAVAHTVETLVSSLDAANSGGETLVSTATRGGGWVTVIQNSLNGTSIQHSRQLNIQLDNLGAALNRIPDDMRDPVLQVLNHR